MLTVSHTRDWAKWHLEHPYIKKGRKHGVSEEWKAHEGHFGDKAGSFGDRLTAHAVSESPAAHQADLGAYRKATEGKPRNEVKFMEGHLKGQSDALAMADRHFASGLSPEQIKVKVKARGSKLYRYAKQANERGDVDAHADYFGQAKAHYHVGKVIGATGAKPDVEKPPEPKPPEPPKIDISPPSEKEYVPETKYLKGSPKYKAFMEGHALAFQTSNGASRQEIERRRDLAKASAAKKGPGEDRARDEGAVAGFQHRLDTQNPHDEGTAPPPPPSPPPPTVSPAPEPKMHSEANFYEPGSEEHRQFDLGYSAAHSAVTTTPGLTKARAQRRLDLHQENADRAGTNEERAFEQGIVQRYQEHVQSLHEDEYVPKTENTYEPGTEEHATYEEARKMGRELAQSNGLSPAEARAEAAKRMEAAKSEHIAMFRARQEGSAKGLLEHADEREAASAALGPIPTEAKSEALRHIMRMQDTLVGFHNSNLAGTITAIHTNQDAPLLSRREAARAHLMAARGQAVRRNNGYLSDDIKQKFAAYDEAIGQAGDKGSTIEFNRETMHNPNLVREINDVMSTQDSHLENEADAKAVIDWHARLAKAIGAGEATPSAPQLSAEWGNAFGPTFAENNVAGLRERLEKMIEDPEANLAVLRGSSVRDIANHQAVMAKGAEIDARIQARPEVQAAIARAREAQQQWDQIKGDKPALFPKLADFPDAADYDAAVEAWRANDKQYNESRKTLRAAVDDTNGEAIDTLQKATMEELAKERSFGPGGADPQQEFQTIRATRRQGRIVRITPVAPTAGAQTKIKKVNIALQHYPTDWVSASAEKGPLQVITNADKRAFYVTGTGLNAISIPEKEEAVTVIHEIGHRMEQSVSGLQRLERAHNVTRTSGESLQQLTKLQPQFPYGDHERVYADAFIDPYVGKVYENKADSSHEIFTVGAQSVLGKAEKVPKGADRNNRNNFGGLVGLEGQKADPLLRQFVLGTVATVGKRT